MISTSSPYSKLKPNENISGIDISALFAANGANVLCGPYVADFSDQKASKLGQKCFFLRENTSIISKNPVFLLFLRNRYMRRLGETRPKCPFSLTMRYRAMLMDGLVQQAYFR